uniref:Uncharacterized protein n=1 Tax=Romanomermis culicivorax TaxID=13658 RepID=A0A915IBB7_ROMCU
MTQKETKTQWYIECCIAEVRSNEWCNDCSDTAERFKLLAIGSVPFPSKTASINDPLETLDDY